jgi:hypothetical protein
MTMPEQLWLIFRDNQNLLPKLPALGAHAIEEWARSHAGAIPYIIVVPQTFNGELIFKSHLHIICSAGGMDTGKSKWTRAAMDAEGLSAEPNAADPQHYASGAQASPEARTGSLTRSLRFGDRYARQVGCFAPPLLVLCQ